MEEYRRRIETTRPDRPVVFGGTWWIWGKTQGGRDFCDGPFNTELEGQKVAFELTDLTWYDVKQLATRNMNEATRQLKAMKLEETHSVDLSLQRFKHKL